MITDRDKEIIKFFEQFHFANIRIIEKVFFNHQLYSYNIARNRLEQIKKAGYIDVFHDVATNRNIYVYNGTKKKPSLHRLLLIELYAELMYWGVDVLKFDIEKSWCNGQFMSDAIAVFELPDPYKERMRRYHFFIEVMLSNNPPNLEKYDKLYETGEVQEYLGYNFYPKTVLLITDRNYRFTNLQSCNVVRINTNLDKLVSILL